MGRERGFLFFFLSAGWVVVCMYTVAALVVWLTGCSLDTAVDRMGGR